MASAGHRAANSTHYWGEMDSLHIFCEPKYATSAYFAEFYNSVSSLMYCAAGGLLLTKQPVRADSVVLTLALCLITIGVGSTAFHGTMRYSYELWDELPMVAFMAVALYAKADCLPPRLAPHRRAFVACVLAWAVGLAAVYVHLRMYEVFMNGFTVLVAADFLLALAQRSEHAAIRTARVACLGLTVLGKLLWEVENRACGLEPRVWVLHVAWHALSCAAAYLGIIANLAYRVEAGVSSCVRGRRATLEINWPLFRSTVRVRGPATGARTAAGRSSSDVRASATTRRGGSARKVQ